MSDRQQGWFEPGSGREWPLGPNYIAQFPSGTKQHASWATFRIAGGSGTSRALFKVLDCLRD
jgi:hypothetical protein